MSNISYPNKSTGDLITASEMNEIKTAVNSKVDTVSGKQLSTEDYSTAEKTKLAAQSGVNTGDQDLSGKVDKVSGKQLSSEDFTSVEKTKLSGIATGATVNQSDATLLNRTNHTGTQSSDTLTDGVNNRIFTSAEKTKLSGIATSATANDTDANLKNRANHTGTQSADTIINGTTNKVFTTTEQTKLAGIATGATANDTDTNLKNRANHTGVQAATTITNDSTHRFVTDAEKTAWSGKQDPLVSGTTIKTINGTALLGSGDITISGSGGVTLGETSATAYRGDRGLVAYNHSQLVTGNPHNVTKAQVGLGNVDNTSDLSKPISTLTQTALNGKQDTLGFTAVPTTRTVAGKALSANITLVKADVGLGNVDNTTDAAKPVSTAQAAINALKADLVSGLVPLAQIPVLTAAKLPDTPFNDWFVQDVSSLVIGLNEDKLTNFINALIASAGGGSITPTAPNGAIDTVARTLTLSHTSYASTELEYSTNAGSTWTNYTVPINFGSGAVAAGAYRYRVKAATGRNSGVIASNPAIDAVGAGDGTLMAGHSAIVADNGLIGNSLTAPLDYNAGVYTAPPATNINVTTRYSITNNDYIAITAPEGADCQLGVVDRYEIRGLYGVGLYQETPGGPVYPYYVQAGNAVDNSWTSGDALAVGDKLVLKFDTSDPGGNIFLIPYKSVDSVNLIPLTPAQPIEFSSFVAGNNYVALQCEKGTTISHPSGLGLDLIATP